MASSTSNCVRPCPARSYYCTVRNDGTVRFWQKIRYGITHGIFRKSTVRKFGIIFSVPYTFRTPVMHALHFSFQVLHFFFLHFSFLPVTLPRQLRLPLTIHHQSPLTISSYNNVNKLNCYAIIYI